MKARTKVVVIGGGIAGCSTLYHLTQEGWSDVVLVERNELTSGTTWHSAAQVTNFGMNQTMVGLKSHSINLYNELANDPEYPINYHHGDGGIRLANTEAQMDGYRHFASMAKGMDVNFEVIDANECAKRHPLISKNNLRCEEKIIEQKQDKSPESTRDFCLVCLCQIIYIPKLIC